MIKIQQIVSRIVIKTINIKYFSEVNQGKLAIVDTLSIVLRPECELKIDPEHQNAFNVQSVLYVFTQYESHISTHLVHIRYIVVGVA